MPNSGQFKFSTALQEVIDDVYERGNLTTKSVHEELMDRYPEVVDEHKDQLIKNAIAAATRRQMKKQLCFLDASQLGLPLDVSGLKVPSHICVPKKNGTDESVWVPTQRSTKNNIDGYAALMEKKGGEIINVARDLKRFSDMLEEIMDEPDFDEPIGPWLKKLMQAA